MVAVLVFSHTRGGLEHRTMASPNTRVELTRDSRMSFRFREVYRQLTDFPVKLTTTAAPSSSCCQAPMVLAFQPISRTAEVTSFGWRVNMTISHPRFTKYAARAHPKKPDPPARMIRFI